MPMHSKVIHRDRATYQGGRHSAMIQIWMIPNSTRLHAATQVGNAVAMVTPGECAPGEGRHALNSGKVHSDLSKAKTGDCAGLARGRRCSRPVARRDDGGFRNSGGQKHAEGGGQDADSDEGGAKAVPRPLASLFRTVVGARAGGGHHANAADQASQAHVRSGMLLATGRASAAQHEQSQADRE